MTFMESKTMILNGEELVKVIHACKQAKVTSLKLGDLEVQFSLTTKQKTEIEKVPSVNLDLNTSDNELPSQNFTEAEKKMLSEFDKQLEMEDLVVSDPTEWERQALLTKGLEG